MFEQIPLNCALTEIPGPLKHVTVNTAQYHLNRVFQISTVTITTQKISMWCDDEDTSPIRTMNFMSVEVCKETPKKRN